MVTEASILLGSVSSVAGRASRHAARAEGIYFAAECGVRLSGDAYTRIALEAAIQAQADLAEAIAALEAALAKEEQSDG